MVDNLRFRRDIIKTDTLESPEYQELLNGLGHTTQNIQPQPAQQPVVDVNLAALIVHHTSMLKSIQDEIKALQELCIEGFSAATSKQRGGHSDEKHLQVLREGHKSWSEARTKGLVEKIKEAQQKLLKLDPQSANDPAALAVISKVGLPTVKKYFEEGRLQPIDI